MKQEKGFTLIELLAVIVILAVIALIAIPQVLNILSKARESAAEDSTYGIVKASENYATKFMLQNNGKMPSEDLVFDCSNEGCKLPDSIKQELNKNYDITNLDALDFKGTKPTSGTVTITDNGKTISTSNLIINGFTCTYENGRANCGDSGSTTTTTKVSPTYYYAFGTPTTSSTTNFLAVGKNVFARIGTDNSTGVCINDKGLFCINTTDKYGNTVAAIKAHFSDSCYDYGSNMKCVSDDFSCVASSVGDVSCYDVETKETCYAYSNGTFRCSK